MSAGSNTDASFGCRQVLPGERKQERDGVVLLNGADLKPQPVDWLWPGWLAAGKYHLLAGSPGLGKTTIAMAIAATVTRLHASDSALVPSGNTRTSSRGSVSRMATRFSRSGSLRGRPFLVCSRYAVRSSKSTYSHGKSSDSPRRAPVMSWNVANAS
ncbi:AAA family ATPase [Burkholderia singularis]|uniref:AAA family ATPase n=1 Tax=Burkholderia singularis TaxID=1503053 RepID=UPI003CC611B1